MKMNLKSNFQTPIFSGIYAGYNLVYSFFLKLSFYLMSVGVLSACLCIKYMQCSLRWEEDVEMPEIGL